MNFAAMLPFRSHPRCRGRMAVSAVAGSTPLSTTTVPNGTVPVTAADESNRPGANRPQPATPVIGGRRIRFSAGVGLALLSISHVGAPAAESTPPSTKTPHTIESLVNETVSANPELKFYESEIAAARAGQRTAAARPNPELTASAGRKSVSSPGLDAEGVSWAVSLVQPFEWPGRIGLRKAIANHDLTLAELGRDRFRTALANRVRLLAFRVFATREQAATAHEVSERFHALREVLVQRDPAGLTPLLETRVIEATELNAQRKAAEAELAARTALIELNHLRAAPATAPLDLAPVAWTFDPAPPLDTLLALARTNSFDLRLRATEFAQQGLRVRLARHERLPAISAGPAFSEENAGRERERFVGVSVSLPLPLWNRNQGSIESAAARQAQAEAALASAERDLDRAVAEAAHRYDTRLSAMQRWRPDAARHFREAAELADRHYRLGAVPIATYVELQKQYLEAVEGLLATKQEALEAAAELQGLTGQPNLLAHPTTPAPRPAPTPTPAATAPSPAAPSQPAQPEGQP